jgi:hypothetical protein
VEITRLSAKFIHGGQQGKAQQIGLEISRMLINNGLVKQP